MKWFIGKIGGVSLDNQNFQGMCEKINEYYERRVKGSYYNVQSSHFFYEEITNGKENDIYESDNIVIVGSMDLEYVPGKFNSCSKYIYSLYLKHGINFVNYLYGTFSVIIYDISKQKVIMVRDQFGMEQLFYVIAEGGVIFSNTLFLLSDYYSETDISTEYIRLFIEHNGVCTFSMTPYKNVHRLEMAHYMEYHLNGCKCREETYWKLTDIPLRKYITYECAIKEFRKLLIESTKSKINNQETTGLMLSGGLDSTVIYSIVNQEDVRAYSAVFDELKSCDEREYIEQTKKKFPNGSIIYVPCDGAGFFENYPQSYFYTTEPHLNCINKRFAEILFEQSERDNVRYVVDGFLADHILSGNIIYLLDYVNLTKIPYICRQIVKYAGYRNMSFKEVVLEELSRAKRDNEFIPQIDKRMTVPHSNKLGEAARYNGKEMIIQIQSTVARNFGDRELAPRYALEVLHPYVDRKIIEFLYSLPGELLLHDGEPKSLVKDAFYNDIPEMIRTRVCKTQHVELSQKGMRDNWEQIYPIIKEGIITHIGCIDLEKEEWVNMLNQFRSGQEFNDQILLYITLEIWCHTIVNRYGTIHFFD